MELTDHSSTETTHLSASSTSVATSASPQELSKSLQTIIGMTANFNHRKRNKKKSVVRLKNALKNSPQSAILWGLEDSLANRVKKLHKELRFDGQSKNRRELQSKKIRRLSEKIKEKESSFENAILLLALAQRLPTLIESFENPQFRQVLTELLEVAMRPDTRLDTEPLVQLVNRVEVPLTIMLHWKKMRQPQSIELAMTELECIVEEFFDGDGWPHASCIKQTMPMAATLNRTYCLCVELGFKLKDELRSQIDWLVRQTLRMHRPNHSLAFQTQRDPVVGSDFRKSLLRMASDTLDKKIAKRISMRRSVAEKLKILPDPSSLSEWGEVGAMQTHWGPRAAKIAFSFFDGNSHLEVIKKHVLICGDCTPSLAINGQPLLPHSGFSVVCWHTDSNADYLELEMGFEQDVVLQRQIMLLRRDEIALVSDSISSENDMELQYACKFPLAEGIKCIQESETREVYLAKKRIQSLVIPLTLPEWKREKSPSHLIIEENNIVLEQTGRSRGMFAGMLLDLNASRSVQPRTWRRLTIAESLRPVAPDEAVAFRIRIGGQQWVIYRCLGEKRNRSFLGVNFADDFYVGSIFTDGAVKELLQII